MPDKNLTKGSLAPVAKWVEPPKRPRGTTVGNQSGLGFDGPDPEGSPGRIKNTGQGVRGRSNGSHERPDIPGSNKVKGIMSRPTPAKNTKNPLK